MELVFTFYGMGIVFGFGLSGIIWLIGYLLSLAMNTVFKN